MNTRTDIGAQCSAIFESWGMTADQAGVVAEVLSWADLHGIDSHGISMLTMYNDWRLSGRLNVTPDPRIVNETPVSVLVDGDGGLGHIPATMAMHAIIAKAKKTGIAAAAVRHASHYGACGYYTQMAADAGLVAITTTTTPGVRVAPTGGREAKLGTDPISFSAPAETGGDFLLDMATTTVAYGKIRNKANENVPCPAGWILSPDGQPSTDPLDAVENGGFQTPLGGTRDGSSHKGYGLSMMVNILSSCLSGARLVVDPEHTQRPGELGHFFLVLDPGLFRDPADFRRDVATLCNDLRSTLPADPATPVLVAGDPERQTAERRTRDGIVIPQGLGARLRDIARQSGVDWRLDPAGAAAGIADRT